MTDLNSFLADVINNQQFNGMLERGNIDLTKRPQVKNDDGSISTVRSMSVNIDGQEVLIPTVIGDKVVSDDEAVDHYMKTGEHLGKFKTPKDATAYAQALHREQDMAYSPVSPVGQLINLLIGNK